MSTNPEPLPDEESSATAHTEQRPIAAAPKRKITGTRTSYTWVGLVIGVIVAILLLVFILQNLDSQQITLYFWTFSLPFGVTILLSAIVGALVMTLVGGVRILQLRRQARRR